MNTSTASKLDTEVERIAYYPSGCDIGHLDTIKGIAEQLEVADIWWHPSDEQSRCTASLLVRPGKRQDVLDSLQKVLDSDETAHIIVGRAGAVLSRSLKRRGDDEEGLFSADVSREELRDDVERGARLDRNYLLFGPVVHHCGYHWSNRKQHRRGGGCNGDCTAVGT